MMETFENAWNFAWPHWPGLAWSLLAVVVGQVAKNAIFTKKQAAVKRKSQPFWWWMRKTLPLHPVVVGAVIGLMWQDPMEGQDWPFVGSVIYFAFFGAISTWLYEVIKGLAKSKGIELRELGRSEPPVSAPAPEPLDSEDTK